MRMLAVRLGDEVIDRIDKLSNASYPRVSRSEMIRRALSVGLAVLEQRYQKARKYDPKS